MRKQIPHHPPAAAALSALQSHWPEYLIEASALGIFMISACVFGVLLDHPASALHQAIENPLYRRMVGGAAMGVTLVGLVYSPWGKQSGAHMNPAVTLTFLTLGKIERWDAFFYVAAQFNGGVAGVAVSSILIGFPLKHSAVNYAATVPGPDGPGVAFGAEFMISALMMGTILAVSNTRGLSRYTGLFAAALLAICITIEAPLSGVSMNPARTVGSAVPAMTWTDIWLYFAAPMSGMLAAAFAYRALHQGRRVFCAKLHHDNTKRCIFRCNYGAINVN
jgi:aquaporin Z